MNALLTGKIDTGQSAAIKRRQKLRTLGGIGTGRATPPRNTVLLHARVFITTRPRRLGGGRLSAYVCIANNDGIAAII